MKKKKLFDKVRDPTIDPLVEIFDGAIGPAEVSLEALRELADGVPKREILRLVVNPEVGRRLLKLSGQGADALAAVLCASPEAAAVVEAIRNHDPDAAAKLVRILPWRALDTDIAVQSLMARVARTRRINLGTPDVPNRSDDPDDQGSA